MFQNRKGFTLIELLIVITIIGILAVAFLPTLLGAPSKGRDTQRIADLQKLQKVMVNADLEGKAFPNLSVCIGVTDATTGTKFVDYVTALGGALPKQPSILTGITPNGLASCTNYAYLANPGNYKFGLYTRVENAANANTECTALTLAPSVLVPVSGSTVAGNYCYAILTQ